MSTKKPDLFISYTAGDSDVARIIAELARGAGLTVWFDHWPVQVGDSVATASATAIQNASVAAIIVGKSANNRTFLDEVGALAAQARTKGRPKLVAVILPDATGDIPDALREFIVIDLRAEEGIADRLAGLLKSVQLAVGLLLRECSDDSSTLAKLCVAIGKRLYSMKNRVEAQNLFDKAVSLVVVATANQRNPPPQGLLAGILRQVAQLFSANRQVPLESSDSPLQSLVALLGNWAGEMYDQGDYAGARHAQEQLLTLLTAAIGKADDPTTLALTNNLALSLKAQGDLAGARVLEETVLSARRRILGAEHPDTLTSMNNLAATLQAQGNLSGARKLQESALATRRRVLGEEHPATLASMNNLASTFQAQGDLAGALGLQKSALATRRRVLGTKHPATLTAMNNLASTLQAQGDLAGARELEESVLAEQRQILGDEHPDTLTSMNNLASTFWAQGDLAGARELEESVLAIRRRVLGAEHPETLSSMNNLGSTLKAQGELAGARELQESALAIQSRVLGDEHPDTLTSMNNLAGTIKGQGDLVGARKLQESVLAGRRRLLGEQHPDTVSSAWNLLITSSQLDDHAAVDDLVQRHMLPLLHADPSDLGADLVHIRNRLLALFEDDKKSP